MSEATRRAAPRAASENHAEPIISGYDLVKTYQLGEQTIHALDGVTLEIPAGQFVAIMGASGSGKSTLLYVLTGLDSPDAGEVIANERHLARLSREELAEFRRDSVGFIFQQFYLVPTLSALENVALPGVFTHVAREAREARAARLLDLLGMGDRLQNRPHQLSGGQQQRIALARALAPEPRLLLLDEPFSSLDVDLREHLAQELRAILKAAGTTALFVTHDQLEAFALGDAIGVMHQGRLEQWGDAYSLYHRPATRFVARFIGHGVFTPARIVACAHGPCVHTPFGELDDPHECPLPDAYPGGSCDLLLRADDVIHDDASPVKAQIERKAFRGSEFLYTLRLASGEQLMAHVPSHHNHAVGEWIGIRPAVDHVVTFPREAAPQHTTAG